ncbi:hypothetical protein VNO80_25610 [Phaseolus coccineus]|uniref:non-specific serine/threonine protein kinase n=1 Tax=Phaseolus coccineus TaxID=3886 RepID=A0AAN9LY58_PHACN
MLLYEYMPNRSLDSFIFDSVRGKLLDWPIRFNILAAIARGLLYLHQDSRLRIIHRDLKASNILLDDNMNPKISDFGLAKMCGGDQVEGNTNRIVGTYGYMAPEYALNGVFSTKSDVFSFGVLLLETVTGKKNRAITCEENSDNLIGHAWRMWKKGIPEQVLDANIVDSTNLNQRREVSDLLRLGLKRIHAKQRKTLNMLKPKKGLEAKNELTFVEQMLNMLKLLIKLYREVLTPHLEG